jgi:hypothetical protein
MLHLQHDFYNIILKIKHKLLFASRSVPPPPPLPPIKTSACAPEENAYNFAANSQAGKRRSGAL